eukprot:CAMPEP_0174362750 /NCGR_PEP_ID=MMETSP0811_2-20130205/65918_1 /TAXON_ID=73025 ORGANISM="Eutreptiella gymnastica-like, Strain CCMP1594" /NCGR_SAMPLE_ID=MMETSP0811_2 /ASSEMBLY_ACC=CAM_ASM_000667 /LENGTH=65 /DNA_ID=CAMNT_0015500775 /DNA_START=185 /DNA_END=379 /DNA_ORIENTATION=-
MHVRTAIPDGMFRDCLHGVRDFEPYAQNLAIRVHHGLQAPQVTGIAVACLYPPPPPLRKHRLVQA